MMISGEKNSTPDSASEAVTIPAQTGPAGYREAPTKLAIKIEIEYDNGEVWRATGEDAVAILQSWQSAQVMEYIHGRPYSGPVMKKVLP